MLWVFDFVVVSLLCAEENEGKGKREENSEKIEREVAVRIRVWKLKKGFVRPYTNGVSALNCVGTWKFRTGWES